MLFGAPRNDVLCWTVISTALSLCHCCHGGCRSVAGTACISSAHCPCYDTGRRGEGGRRRGVYSSVPAPRPSPNYRTNNRAGTENQENTMSIKMLESTPELLLPLLVQLGCSRVPSFCGSQHTCSCRCRAVASFDMITFSINYDDSKGCSSMYSAFETEGMTQTSPLLSSWHPFRYHACILSPPLKQSNALLFNARVYPFLILGSNQ